MAPIANGWHGSGHDFVWPFSMGGQLPGKNGGEWRSGSSRESFPPNKPNGVKSFIFMIQRLVSRHLRPDRYRGNFRKYQFTPLTAGGDRGESVRVLPISG